MSSQMNWRELAGVRVKGRLQEPLKLVKGAREVSNEVLWVVFAEVLQARMAGRADDYWAREFVGDN